MFFSFRCDLIEDLSRSGETTLQELSTENNRILLTDSVLLAIGVQECKEVQEVNNITEDNPSPTGVQSFQTDDSLKYLIGTLKNFFFKLVDLFFVCFSKLMIFFKFIIHIIIIYININN